MKKIISIIVIVLMHLPVIADNPEIQPQLRWIFDDQGVLTIQKNSTMQDYSEGNAPWSYLRDKIKKVIVEEGVTNIGRCAFWGFRNMVSVSLPKSIETIGDRAFYNCSSLEEVVVPKSVTTIGAEAFYKCSSLKQVTLPKGLKKISNGLFRKCNNLKTLQIPDNVTSIGDYAFEGCAILSPISIPKNVNTIGNYAFKGCASILNLTIPEGVTTIGIETFGYCTFLEKVTLSSSVQYINRNAFVQCPRLVDVYINSSSVPQAEGNPFGNNSKKIYFYVPSDRMRNYEHDKYWSRCMLRPIGGQEESYTEPASTTSSMLSADPVLSTTQTTPTSRNTYIVTASSRLNVRSAANSSASVIGSVQSGDTIHVDKIENDTWGRILWHGKTGYVSTQYIREITTPVLSYVEERQTITTSSTSSFNSSSLATSTSVPSTSSATYTESNADPATVSSQGITLGMFLDVAGFVGKRQQVDAVFGGLGGDFTIGFFTPKRMNFLGAGFGVEALFCNPSKDLSTTTLYMPFFANDKLYFSSSDIDPYLDVSLGGFVTLMTKVNDDSQAGKGGGFFMRTGLGLELQHGTNISIGYQLMFENSIDYAVHMAYLKIGIGSR